METLHCIIFFMSSKVLGEREFKNHIIERMRNLRDVGNSGKMLISGNLVDDNLQKVLVLSKRTDWFGSVFLPVIESSALDAERVAPGAGSTYLRLFLGLLGSDIRQKITFDQDDTLLESILDSVNTSTPGVCTRSDFHDHMTDSLSLRSREIVERAFNIYSLGDQINVKKSYLRDTIVSKTTGYTFDNVSFNRLFTQTGSWNRNDVNVILIDGIIETVSEIHHLLEHAHKSGESYLVICTGILPEPLNVIIQNVMRKTIDVIVGIINPDEFGIHTLVDLGTASLTEPISATRGETISQFVTREIVKVDRVEINHSTMTLQNKIAQEATSALLRDVILRAEKDIDVAYLFQKRIKSLSSSRIVVSIGRDDIDHQPNVIEEVDIFLRGSHMMLSRGFVKKSSLSEFPNHIVDLLFGGTNAQPSARIEKALECYISTRDQINKTGTVIIEERE